MDNIDPIELVQQFIFSNNSHIALLYIKLAYPYQN
jgi:uncharacterized membrane protein SpoIIM required for sporulation